MLSVGFFTDNECPKLAESTRSQVVPPTSAFSKTSAIESSPASGSTVPTGVFKTFYQGPQPPGQNPNIQYPKNFRKKPTHPSEPTKPQPDHRLTRVGYSGEAPDPSCSPGRTRPATPGPSRGLQICHLRENLGWPLTTPISAPRVPERDGSDGQRLKLKFQGKFGLGLVRSVLSSFED